MKLSREKLSELLGETRLDARKENLVAKCPQCGYKEFGISLSENHLFGCYRKKMCGFSGNIYTLLHYLGKYEEYVTKGEVYSVDEKSTVIKKIIQESSNIYKLDTLPDIELPIGWKRTFDNSYLNKRGFVINDYYKFPVGTTIMDSKLENYVIFLIKENQLVKATVARHIWDKKKIDNYNKRNPDNKIQRYRNSSSDFEKIVLGLDELSYNTKILVIVEGIFDKKNTDTLLELDSQEEIKCVGTFKCHISPSQLFKIKDKAPNIDTVILFYDNDVLKEILIAANTLECSGYKVLILYNDSLEKDAGDITMTELNSLFESPWSLQSLSAKKIQKKRLV